MRERGDEHRERPELTEEGIVPLRARCLVRRHPPVETRVAEDDGAVLDSERVLARPRRPLDEFGKGGGTLSGARGAPSRGGRERERG